MPKVRTPETSFEFLRESELLHLDILLDWATWLGEKYPESGFADHIPRLTRVRNKIDDSISPCLTNADLQIIASFREHLMNHPKFAPKLRQFYQIIAEFAKAIHLSKTIVFDKEKQSLLISRFNEVEKLTGDIFKEVKNDPDNILSIASIMLLMIGRKETFDYLMKGYLKDALNQMQTGAQFDLEEVLSVDTKVPHGSNSNGPKYETDVHAVRDCISHYKYAISKDEKTGKNCIKFEWIEQGGYNFSRSFAGSEFVHFFKEYFLFQKLQGLLLIITMHEVLMRQYWMQ